MGNSVRRVGCLQFSLRTMLLLMTVSALACGALFAAPPIVGLSIVGIFLLFFTPTVLAIVVIYGSGYGRTFAIGALIPLGVLFQAYSPYFLYYFMAPDFVGDSIVTRLIIAACLGGALVFLAINGGVAMLARWLLERSRHRGQAESEGNGPGSPFDDESTSA
jgi:hypothetical protein